MLRVAFAALLSLVSVAAFSAEPSGIRDAARPNIIFILSDDLGYGDYGVFFQNLRRERNDRAQPWHRTPQLDALAAEGLQLRQHYCAAPVCAPSRASLLLGVHQGHANVRDNQFDKALEDNHTLATVLRGAGYATAAIGKWGLQGGPAEKSPAAEKATPADWPAYPTRRGFDDYFGYVRHGDGHWHYPHEDGRQVWANEREVSADLAGCYTTDLFTARAKKYITEQHGAHPQQPFFLYLAYDTPHAKLQLPPGAYPAGGGAKGGVQWLGTPGRMINTANGQPDSFVHPDYASATWDHDHDAATPEQLWPDVYRRYATDVRRIDDCVGDLLQLLKELAIDEQTLVVFTTDNGPSRESYLPEDYEPNFFHSFGPFDGIKRDVWEGGIRTGALVRWPGGAAGKRVSDQPCQAQDWMATFAELAGVLPPARCDGTSLGPTITGHGAQPPSAVYVEYAQGQKTPDYPEFEAMRRGRVRQQMQAVRVGDFMGVRYQVAAHGDPFEIYNVIADPKQATNLAFAHPELQQLLHDRVLQMRRPDASAKRPYDSEAVPAVAAAQTASGLTWRSFDSAMPWLGKLDIATPAHSGACADFAELKIPADSTASLCSGYLNVPTEGDYTFTLPKGATALLRIHAATVVDAAFRPAESPMSGTIRLAAGLHPFRLYWLTSSESPAPKLNWTTPGEDARPIPATALSCEISGR